MNNNRLRVFVIGLGALLVVAVLTFPLWRPLLVNNVVDEVFPGLNPTQQIAFQTLLPTQQFIFQDMMKTSQPMAMEEAKAMLSPDEVVPTEEQAMPQMTDPQIVAAGEFIQIDAVHGASGTATIYQLPDNSMVLRLEDFRSTNGPDLYVILTKHADPRTAADVGLDYVELGALKGNVGNQNYSVPAEVDLNVYKGVVIFCKPFQVVFSVASLELS